MGDAGAETAVRREEPFIGFSFQVKGILPVLGLGLVLRLLLAALPGFEIDLGTFRAWSFQLAENNPWNFYESDFFTDYAPGYMYVLLLIGKLHNVFSFTTEQYDYVLKLPAIAADLGSAYLLYRLLETQRAEVRLSAALLYLLFPAALLIGPVWGQVDSLLAFFVLLSVYFIARDRPVAGAVAFTIGFLAKPQAIAALPFLAFWIIREHPPQMVDVRPGLRLPLPPKLWYQITGISLAVLVLVIFPFFTYQPWELIGQLYRATDVENYRVNSFWAYNFYTIFGLFDGGFKPDTSAGATSVLGLETRYWGLLLFVFSLAAVIFSLRKARGTGALALGTALCMLAFYMFVTRMHERYVFAFFLPFLAACVLLNTRVLWAAFIALAFVHFANLYHVYIYYNPNDLKVDWFYNWLASSDFLGTGLETIQVLSAAFFAGLIVLVVAAYDMGRRKLRAGGT